MRLPNIRSGTITAIKEQARDAGRVSVHLDGAFGFGLAKTVAAESGLRVGQALTEEDVQRLLGGEEVEQAVDAALRLLAVRARTRRELRDRLTRRGLSDAAVETALERLDAWGYLDDAAFARQWIDDRTRRRPRGERLLREELRRHGVSDSVAAEAVAAAEIDETGAAVELARGRLARLRGLDPDVQRRRLAAFLQRRGYGWDTVRAALDAVLGDAGDET